MLIEMRIGVGSMDKVAFCRLNQEIATRLRADAAQVASEVVKRRILKDAKGHERIACSGEILGDDADLDDVGRALRSHLRWILR